MQRLFPEPFLPIVESAKEKGATYFRNKEHFNVPGAFVAGKSGAENDDNEYETLENEKQTRLEATAERAGGLPAPEKGLDWYSPPRTVKFDSHTRENEMQENHQRHKSFPERPGAAISRFFVNVPRPPSKLGFFRLLGGPVFMPIGADRKINFPIIQPYTLHTQIISK